MHKSRSGEEKGGEKGKGRDVQYSMTACSKVIKKLE